MTGVKYSMKNRTIEENQAIRTLNNLKQFIDEPEVVHARADKAILTFLCGSHKDIFDAYKELQEKCSWWACA